MPVLESWNSNRGRSDWSHATLDFSSTSATETGLPHHLMRGYKRRAGGGNGKLFLNLIIYPT